MSTISESVQHTRNAPYDLTGDGKLLALQYPYSLDAPLSTHAPDDTGFASANCYLLLEDDAAHLIDTGFTLHRQPLLDDLSLQVGPHRTLSLQPLRMGEMNSICNVRSIVSALNVGTLYGSMGDPASLVDFLPQDVPYGTPPRQGVMARLEVGILGPGSELSIGSHGRRMLDVLAAPLQLLPFNWAYDRGTKTLFSSDVFAYRRRPQETGPWQVSEVHDMAPDDEVYHHLTHTRFWWLPGADTRGIGTALRDLFARFEVHNIAPAFGALLQGPEVVRAHIGQLLRILDRAQQDQSIGVAAGRWTH